MLQLLAASIVASACRDKNLLLTSRAVLRDQLVVPTVAKAYLGTV